MHSVSGGLFGVGDEDISVENAFLYAVYRVNHEDNLLPKGTKLLLNITRLPIDDGFRASKRGKIIYIVNHLASHYCNAIWHGPGMSDQTMIRPQQVMDLLRDHWHDGLKFTWDTSVFDP